MIDWNRTDNKEIPEDTLVLMAIEGYFEEDDEQYVLGYILGGEVYDQHEIYCDDVENVTHWIAVSHPRLQRDS